MANNLELYNRTIDIIYKAYFNDTLRHSNCYACAVGNIIAANKGYVFAIDKASQSENRKFFWEGFKPYSLEWDNRGNITDYPAWFGFIINTPDDCNINVAIEQIEITGYNISQLSEIECAFERAERGKCSEDYMFNGLVAVLEVLKQIHEIKDNTEQVERFRTHRDKTHVVHL